MISCKWREQLISGGIEQFFFRHILNRGLRNV